MAQARNLQTAGWKELLGKEDEDENQEPLLPIVKKGQILYCERGEVVSKKNATAETIYRCNFAFSDDRDCAFCAR